MDFEWDTAKSAWTKSNRGFDFDFALFVFADPKRIDRPDTRRSYGEERRQVIGQIDGNIYFIAYTLRNGRTRIISARKAHDIEEKNYRSSLGTPQTH